MELDRKRSLERDAEIRERIRMGIYWGFLGQSNVPLNTEPSRAILVAMAAAGRHPPLRGLELKAVFIAV